LRAILAGTVLGVDETPLGTSYGTAIFFFFSTVRFLHPLLDRMIIIIIIFFDSGNKTLFWGLDLSGSRGMAASRLGIFRLNFMDIQLFC